MHSFDSFAVGAVDNNRRPELFGDTETVVIKIDNDDVCRGIELRCQERRKADRSGTDNRHRITWIDGAFEHAALIACGQNIAEHHHGILVRAIGNGIKTCIGIRNADKLGLGSINSVAQNPSPCSQWEGMPRLQYSHFAHAVMQEIKTRSPLQNLLTPVPTSSTTPIPSCPRIRPSATEAKSPFRMCRSVPQIVVLVIRTTASVTSRSAGFGTSSKFFFPGP